MDQKLVIKLVTLIMGPPSNGPFTFCYIFLINFLRRVFVLFHSKLQYENMILQFEYNQLCWIDQFQQPYEKAHGLYQSPSFQQKLLPCYCNTLFRLDPVRWPKKIIKFTRFEDISVTLS